MDRPRDIQSFHFVSKTKLKKYCPSHWFCAIGWLYPQFFFSLKPSRIDENLHVYFHQIGIFGSLGKKDIDRQADNPIISDHLFCTFNLSPI